MKKITLLLFLLVSSVIYSQKNGISYQAVILNPNGGKVPGVNNSNEPLANKNVCLQFTIIDSDTRTEYQETINTTTDAFGMVNTIIGSGNQSAGYAASFSNIYWTSDQKSLKVAMDINGKCATFVEISNQIFTSVPSAFSAQNAENVTGVVSIESGGTNAVTVLGAKTNLALEKVDNTSDLSKPISTATQIILNLKEDSANKSTDLTIDANSNVKYPTVQAVKTYIDANASTGLAGLAAETARATAAESANANAIASNTIAITANANAIAAEAATARAAELANANAIASNTTAITANANAITTEAATARAAELALTNNLATEATTARAAELANATAITAETSRATAAESVLTTSIATETTNRTNADNSLSTNLATEVTNRTNADVLKEDLVNKSTDVTTDGASDIKYPSVKSVKTYVDNANATNANLTGPITSVGNATSVASQTGTGSKFVMDTTPTLVTPVLGVATATSVNGTVIPTSKTLVVTTDKLNVLAATTSVELAGIISDETGTGSVVLSDSPIFTGTPSLPTGTMAVTQAAGNNTPAVATTEFVKTAISNAIIEVSDEFTATASQTAFTLTQTPSSNSKVKMYVNGIRISKTAYSVSGTTLTYNPTNNGTYALSLNDRIQFDYFY